MLRLTIMLLATLMAACAAEYMQPDYVQQHWRLENTSYIPLSVREYWMQVAIDALPSPCTFAAFGTAIVNHTSSPSGDLVCTGANNISSTGNPTLHGEIAAIDNCTTILTDPNGRYNMTPSEADDAYADLTLYTSAESCPMCASAIRWAGFKEYVFGTSIKTLIEMGWGQINVTSEHIFRHSGGLGTETKLIGGILTNVTDPLFAWQYNDQYACPKGCERAGNETCLPVTSDAAATVLKEL